MRFRLAILGCGNPVRADDGVGPLLVRRLWERNLPPDIKLIDGGTSGIDVVFHMQEADTVLIIDSCHTGNPPGSIYKVPSEEVEELPSREEANLHSIKWFHAIALAKHLLNGNFPKRIEVFLIEGKNFHIGEKLSQEVKGAMEELIDYILKEYVQMEGKTMSVELNEEGYIKIPVDIAQKYFAESMSVAVIPRGMEFHIFPLPNDKQGGLLLKRLNRQGDRAVLVWEMLPPGIKSGKKPAVWNEKEKALVVALV